MVEEILKINEDTLGKLSELDKSKVYLMQIDVGDEAPVWIVKNWIAQLKEIFDKHGIEVIITVFNKEHGVILVNELQKYLDKKEEK